MKELLKKELLSLLRIWLFGCKHDTREIYEDCKKCPSRTQCKRASRQIRKLIEDMPKVTFILAVPKKEK